MHLGGGVWKIIAAVNFSVVGGGFVQKFAFCDL